MASGTRKSAEMLDPADRGPSQEFGTLTAVRVVTPRPSFRKVPHLVCPSVRDERPISPRNSTLQQDTTVFFANATLFGPYHDGVQQSRSTDIYQGTRSREVSPRAASGERAKTSRSKLVYGTVVAQRKPLTRKASYFWTLRFIPNTCTQSTGLRLPNHAVIAQSDTDLVRLLRRGTGAGQGLEMVQRLTLGKHGRVDWAWNGAQADEQLSIENLEAYLR